MGPWADLVTSVAAVLAIFLAVMAFRGLVGAFDRGVGRCDSCGRMPLLPLPLTSHLCWRCHHPGRHPAS